MRVLVVNCGSSSVKAEVLDPHTGERLERVVRERVTDVGQALREVLAELAEWKVDAVAHRVVHGGERFTEPVLVDAAVLDAVTALSHLAPLHNPANLAGLRAAMESLPDVPHVAVFDTAFHATLPPRARAYALPHALASKHGLRRFGFHGPSHAIVAQRAADHLKADVRTLRIITCHLGNGASVCAVENGRSVETSMGMTPLEGLVMGTRAGDVDAGVLLEVMRREGLDVDGLDRLLNKQSGLAGLSGTAGDLRDIEARAAEGDAQAQLAMGVFAHRVRKYIGAYAAVMGGVDVIAFTAGIGENSASMRSRIAQRLEFLGAVYDDDANRDAHVDDSAPVAEFSASHSRCRLLVVRTDEALMLAREAARLVANKAPVGGGRIPIAVSARHIHLTQEAVEALFGAGHQLTPYKPLSQPGQFACVEQLSIVGPRKRIDNVRVLGPVRPACQVEISRTDEFLLGIDAPVRESGHVAGSPGITLEGPAGRLVLAEGVICAKRHIHMTPEDAVRFGVNDKDIVAVKIDSDGRDLTLGDVVVRVSPKFALEMHLDTDEANAAEIAPSFEGELVVSGVSGALLRRDPRRDDV